MNVEDLNGISMQQAMVMLSESIPSEWIVMFNESIPSVAMFADKTVERGDDDLPVGPEHTVTDINGVPRRGYEIAAVEVTPEMVAAADEFECYFHSDYNTFSEIASDIYRAMAALAPTPLVSPAEDALRQDRDLWKREHDICVRQRDIAIQEGDALRAELMAARDTVKQITEERDAANRQAVEWSENCYKAWDEQAAWKSLHAEVSALLIERTQERDKVEADYREMSEHYEGLLKQYYDRHNELRTQFEALQDALKQRTQERDPALATIHMYENDRAGVLFSATNLPEDIERKPDPIANAIRPRETDRRRIGG